MPVTRTDPTCLPSQYSTCHDTERRVHGSSRLRHAAYTKGFQNTSKKPPGLPSLHTGVPHRLPLPPRLSWFTTTRRYRRRRRQRWLHCIPIIFPSFGDESDTSLNLCLPLAWLWSSSAFSAGRAGCRTSPSSQKHASRPITTRACRGGRLVKAHPRIPLRPRLTTPYVY